MKARRRGDTPVAFTGSALPALRESRTGELRVGDSESIRESRDRPVGDRNVAAPTATLLFAVAAFLLFAASSCAHNLPLSYVDLRISENGVDATIETSAKNLARELPEATEEMLLANAPAQKDLLLAAVRAGLTITANEEALSAELLEAEPLLARKDLRLRLAFPWKQRPETITVRCGLFSSDPRHKTFLNVYQGETLQRQQIFDKDSFQIDYRLSSRQRIGDVVTQFLREGVRHIFIGPDHILFLVGLLLLGGTLSQLLRIVTAFTLAHSVTLVLATLNVLSPPARVIEPMIALSIIFVGAHALWQSKEGAIDDCSSRFASGLCMASASQTCCEKCDCRAGRSAGRSSHSTPASRSDRPALFWRLRRFWRCFIGALFPRLPAGLFRLAPFA